MSGLAKKRCIPCEGGMKPLPRERAEALLSELDEWMLIDDAHLLVKQFRFPDFKTAMQFANDIARVAEFEGHHPELTVGWGNVGVELSTHAIGGLSENDFILAAKIDELDSRRE
jgi:4a-hydroxytetrahydrobiopterin dehydratase